MGKSINFQNGTVVPPDWLNEVNTLKEIDHNNLQQQVAAHKADTVKQGVHGLATISAMTLYVRNDGNDSNDGSANDAAHALNTIQAAINRIPQVVNHTVNINIAAGVYNEGIGIAGFSGKGNIRITGAASLADAVNYSLLDISINNCACEVSVKGFNITNNPTGNYVILVRSCSYVDLQYLTTTASGTSTHGIGFFYSNGIAWCCNISNKYYALGSYTSVILSDKLSGNGNTVGLYAAQAGSIGKNDTQPSATTAEITYAGGRIA